MGAPNAYYFLCGDRVNWLDDRIGLGTISLSFDDPHAQRLVHIESLSGGIDGNASRSDTS